MSIEVALIPQQSLKPEFLELVFLEFFQLWADTLRKGVCRTILEFRLGLQETLFCKSVSAFS